MYTDMDFSNNNFITSDRNENCNNSIEIVYKRTGDYFYLNLEGIEIGDPIYYCDNGANITIKNPYTEIKLENIHAIKIYKDEISFYRKNTTYGLYDLISEFKGSFYMNF